MRKTERLKRNTDPETIISCGCCGKPVALKDCYHQKYWKSKNGLLRRKYCSSDCYNKEKVKGLDKTKSAVRGSKRRAKKMDAHPLWANNKKIAAIYGKRDKLNKLSKKKKYAVDHDIPLVSDVVCGLHNEFNLYVLTVKENSQKHNKFDPETYIHRFGRYNIY